MKSLRDQMNMFKQKRIQEKKVSTKKIKSHGREQDMH